MAKYRVGSWGKKGEIHRIDKMDQLSTVSGKVKGCTHVVVNVGNATHDKEWG